MSNFPNTQPNIVELFADLGADLDLLEAEVHLAARLMVALIAPGEGDEDDLDEVGAELEATLRAFPKDYEQIHAVLVRAFAQCKADGMLPGEDFEPARQLLTRLMAVAVENGTRLHEIGVAYERSRIAFFASLKQSRQPVQ